MDHQNRPVSR